MRRRQFVQWVLAAAGAQVVVGCATTEDSGPSGPSGSGAAPEPAGDGREWAMPDEADPHERTWMALAASEEIWGELLPDVRADQARIAQTIARFEPVSMLVGPDDLAAARDLVGPTVDLVPAPLDDLWMRDTGPVFVTSGGARAGVGFNFNGWGGKQESAKDATVAGTVAQRAGVELLRTDLVLEGGGIEVDGEGTALITESCVLNPNRNPGVSRETVEAELGRLLGIDKVVWLPGIAGRDITDGHTDFYARFAGPGVVVAGFEPDPASYEHDVTRRHLEILRTATDARGRPLRTVVIEGPATVRPTTDLDEFAAGYINFYVCNGAVIAPEFGDADADAAAHDTLADLFPDREIVQIDIDAIAAGGGGIHCTTQQQPAV